MCYYRAVRHGFWSTSIYSLRTWFSAVRAVLGMLPSGNSSDRETPSPTTIRSSNRQFCSTRIECPARVCSEGPRKRLVTACSCPCCSSVPKAFVQSVIFSFLWGVKKKPALFLFSYFLFFPPLLRLETPSAFTGWLVGWLVG